MNPQQLAEVICAVHLAHHVEGTLQQRGGLFLVGPPGTLKSTIADTLSTYSDALVLTDINMQLLVDLRDGLAGGSINSLVFTEYAKLYERNPQTAFNVEGSIRALASEGFAAASFQDHRIARRKAHATIVGAMPPAILDKFFKRWEETGFNRRFLWAVYGLKNAHILDEAASHLKRLDFGVRELPRVPPMGKTIPMLLTKDERERARRYVSQQPGTSHTQQIQLMIRVWSVLKWWHKERRTTRQCEATITAFAKALSHDGTDLVLATRSKKR